MTESTTLLRGELDWDPDPFRHYKRPVVARLRYEGLRKSDFFSEVVVSLCVGEQTEDFIVPHHVVDEETGTVAAALVGERGGKILVRFPPTNFDTSTFKAAYEDLARITEASFYAGR